MRPAPARCPRGRPIGGRDVRTPVADAVTDGCRYPTCLPSRPWARRDPCGRRRDTRHGGQQSVRRETECATGSGCTRDDISRPAVKLRRSLTMPPPCRRDCVSEHGGRGVVRAFETEAERDAFATRSRGCWTAPTRLAHIRRCRCAGKGSRGLPDRLYVAGGYLLMQRRQHGGLRQVVDDLPTPNMKNTAPQTWTARPSGSGPLSAYMGKRGSPRVLLVTLVTGAMGYHRLGGADYRISASGPRSILPISRRTSGDPRRPEDAQLIHLIIGSFAAPVMLSLALSGSASHALARPIGSLRAR